MAKSSIIVLVVLSLIFGHCSPKESTMNQATIDIQGHRGTRGLMPENTIPAFIKALELGVKTLELDLTVSKDQLLIVSHDPFMHHEISLSADGQDITKEQELEHNLYQMTYEEIKKYDVGSKFVDRFPKQHKVKVSKPSLLDLVSAVKEYQTNHNTGAIRYNIEIKSQPDGDGIYHPNPQHFSDIVYDFIQEHMDEKLVNIQSFDFRVLQYFKSNYPQIQLAVLIENKLSIDDNLKNLGFTPEIYSCHYPLLDSSKIEYLHSLNLKVIPWTVNETADIKQMIRWGVDGIISDYPNRVIQIVK